MSAQNFINTYLTATERATFYPNQILDADGLCMCANCLSCTPYKFRGMVKPRQCVVCECYNLREIKRFEKQIHCLDCYREANNARRRQQRKAKKEAMQKAKEEVKEEEEKEEEEKEEDFATEWDKDLTTDERVALLAKTFDNKAESDDEEEETWRCEECGRDDMKEEDIGGHLVDGGCFCNDCAKEEFQFKVCNDDVEEEELWTCEECGRDDMTEDDIGGHLKEGGCLCHDCFRDDDESKKKMCFGNL
jgi:hypothetical protein